MKLNSKITNNIKTNIMNEFKGTQGKLQVNDFTFQDEKQEYVGVFDVVNEHGSKFAQVAPYEFFGLTIEQAKSNALLISKAPEMLETLNNFLEITKDFHHPRIDHLRGSARNLIQEATDLSQLEK